MYYRLLSRVLPGGFIDPRTSDLQTHGHGRRPLTDEVDKELILSPSSKTGQHMLAAAVAYGHLMRRFEWKSSNNKKNVAYLENVLLLFLVNHNRSEVHFVLSC